MNSRVKRQATNLVQTVDLKKLLKNDNYSNYIKELTSILTESGEQYDNIKVTKRGASFTKVIVKYDNTEVPFIIRNQNLYIVGWMVGSTFYMEKDSHDSLDKVETAALRKVIHQATIVSLGRSFSYNEILLDAKSIDLWTLPDKLSMLPLVGDTRKRPNIIANNVGPFVIVLAEAIRFPVIANAVQEAINAGEMLKLGRDVKPPGMGNENDVIEINTLKLIWGKLSTCVQTFRTKNTCTVPIDRLIRGKLTPVNVEISKSQLNALLGVANSGSIASPTPTRRRAKRDASIVPLQPLQHHQALLQHHANLLNNDGNQEPYTASSAISTIASRPDVMGALHLLTLGILYLSGGKLNYHHSGETGGRHYNPREAAAIAAELTDRIACFIKSTRTGVNVEFAEEMEIQRQLSTALVQGDRIEPIVEEFIGEHCCDHKNVVDVHMAAEMLSKAVQEGKCF